MTPFSRNIAIIFFLCQFLLLLFLFSPRQEAASSPTPTDFTNTDKDSQKDKSGHKGDSNGKVKPEDPVVIIESSQPEQACLWRKIVRPSAASGKTPCFVGAGQVQNWNNSQCIWQLFPTTTKCSSVTQIGGNWVCDLEGLVSKQATVFSFGTHPDMIFEKNLAEKGCKVTVFNSKLDSEPLFQSNFKSASAPATFSQLDIGPLSGYPGYHPVFESDGKTLYSLHDIQSKVGVSKINLLSFDLNGREWFVIPHFVNKGDVEVDQILVKLYLPENYELVYRFFAYMEEAGYQPFHKKSCGHSCFDFSFKFVGKIDCHSSQVGEVFLPPNLWTETRQAEKPKIFIDVGGHHGDFTASNFNHPNSKVFIFEPLKSNFEIIRSKYEKDSRVSFYNGAVSSEEGEAEFWTSQKCTANPSLADQDFAGMTNCDWQKEIVKVYQIDAFVEKNEILNPKKSKNPQDWVEIDIFKIDTQGYDGHVIEGAKKLLKANKPRLVLVEYWLNGLRAGGSDPAAIIEYIEDFGYLCFNSPSEEVLPDSVYKKLKRIYPNTIVALMDSTPYQHLPKHGIWTDALCVLPQMLRT